MVTKVLLAAGESSRFGQCKLVQQICDKSVIEKTLQTLNSVNSEPTYVISGAWHHKISSHLENVKNVKLLYNPQWHKGLGKSIAFASKKLGRPDRGILFVLADQVALTTDDLNKLIDGYTKYPTRWSARFEQRLSVPAIFPPEDNELLQNLTGKYGAKELLRGNCSKINSIDMFRAAIDIDTPEDLAKVRDLFESGKLEIMDGQCD